MEAPPSSSPFDLLPPELIDAVMNWLPQPDFAQFDSTCTRMRAVAAYIWQKKAGCPRPDGMSAKEWYGRYMKQFRRVGLPDTYIDWFRRYPHALDDTVYIDLLRPWKQGFLLGKSDLGPLWRVKTTLLRPPDHGGRITGIMFVAESQHWIEVQLFRATLYGMPHSWWNAMPAIPRPPSHKIATFARFPSGDFWFLDSHDRQHLSQVRFSVFNGLFRDGVLVDQPFAPIRCQNDYSHLNLLIGAHYLPLLPREFTSVYVKKSQRTAFAKLVQRTRVWCESLLRS